MTFQNFHEIQAPYLSSVISVAKAKLSAGIKVKLAIGTRQLGEGPVASLPGIYGKYKTEVGTCGDRTGVAIKLAQSRLTKILT
jgi:hypothetical protein